MTGTRDTAGGSCRWFQEAWSARPGRSRERQGDGGRGELGVRRTQPALCRGVSRSPGPGPPSLAFTPGPAGYPVNSRQTLSQCLLKQISVFRE